MKAESIRAVWQLHLSTAIVVMFASGMMLWSNTTSNTPGKKWFGLFESPLGPAVIPTFGPVVTDTPMMEKPFTIIAYVGGPWIYGYKQTNTTARNNATVAEILQSAPNEARIVIEDASGLASNLVACIGMLAVIAFVLETLIRWRRSKRNSLL